MPYSTATKSKFKAKIPFNKKKGNYHFTKRIIINDILKDSNNRMDQY